jgi:hypothetical protein
MKRREGPGDIRGRMRVQIVRLSQSVTTECSIRLLQSCADNLGSQKFRQAGSNNGPDRPTLNRFRAFSQKEIHGNHCFLLPNIRVPKLSARLY